MTTSTSNSTSAPPTLEFIASLAGVSTASVSRALNGRPGVSEVNRTAILRIAQEHDFRGNHAARALGTGRTGRLAVALPTISAEYCSRILASVGEVFRTHGLSMTLIATEDHPRDGELMRVIKDGVDGALLILPIGRRRELEYLDRRGMPFVVVDLPRPLPVRASWVNCTNAAGARQAVDHLIAQGHSRIGLMAGDPKLLATVDRLHGCQQALAEAGLPFDDDLLAFGNYVEISSGHHAVLELLNQSDPPTAIFAFSDRLAFGAMRAAHQRNLSVPDDLSIVGFDDLEPARLVTPRLTTVHQPLAEMGTVAAQLLVDWLGGKAPAPGMHIELPTRLIIRESTSPPAIRSSPLRSI